jgi:phosphate transport system regulatory protein PhoU
MAGLAEDQIDKALTALVTRDSALARHVIERDHQVNTLDVEIDEECIRLLALHQPAARDLRLVTTAMKISTELERISDLAENVSERTIELNEEPQLKPYIDIPLMGKMARTMVKESIDAFVKDDSALARKVLADDDFVDDLMEQLFRELLSSCSRTRARFHAPFVELHCQISGTDGRPCYQHRRVGGVSGRGQDHPSYDPARSFRPRSRAVIRLCPSSSFP